MKSKVREIYHAFDGKLVGNQKMKTAVCETVALMPEEIINLITKMCWFIGSMDDAWAFAFTGNDLKDQHLIFLSEELMRQGKNQIRYSITHEIAHVILNHRNSVLVRQSKEEIRRQEKEADEFANSILMNFTS
jgi:Zn-dependent peptidase ImmA (M78 family)